MNTDLYADFEGNYSLGIVNSNLKSILHTPFRTKDKLSKDRIERLGFTEEQMMRAPLKEEIMPMVYELFKGRRIHFWNAEHDIKYMPKLSGMNVKIICEMKRFCGFTGLKKWQPLWTASKVLAIPDFDQNLHIATEDAKKLALCSQRMDLLTQIAEQVIDIKKLDFPEKQKLSNNHFNIQIPSKVKLKSVLKI